MPNHNVRELAGISLRQLGYDGLGCEACSCEIADLMPCDELYSNCTAGFKGPDPEGDSDFIIYPVQEDADAAKAAQAAGENTDG